MPDLWYTPCARQVRGQTIHGYQWDSAGWMYFHHTEFRKLDAIAEDYGLIPSTDPYADGVINFSLNPNFHRFGSIRFLFDRDAVGRQARVLPMCYAFGDETRKLGRVVDEITEPARRAGRPANTWRVQSQIGLEPADAFWSEAKHYTSNPVSLNAVVAVEYWVPWKPEARSSTSIGANVSPCRGLWSTWDSGIPNALDVVMLQAIYTREFAERLGVPFGLKSCYPYASLDGNKAVVLDEVNLITMTAGLPPVLTSTYSPDLPETKCACPPEDLPKPSLP
ncbi:MAG: hypothetical protein Q8R28_08010 [Dehalococcoidia bacterium]|nr:hypothetical protein [Dehalococcoidia bacterium]